MEKYRFSRPVMGGPVTIVFYAAIGSEAAARAAEEAFEAIAEVDRDMSDYRPESALCRLNAASGGGAVSVPEPLLDVLSVSKRIAEMTGGAFDPTVGPLVRLWRRARSERRLPEASEIEAARRHVGYGRIQIDRIGRTVRLEQAGMQLDLGGIAKGYACDRALKVLADRGVRRALVDAAGDFALGDPPPGREAWRIQIVDHPELVLHLVRCGVATSGDSERFVEIDGRRYSHIVNPATGYGLEHMSLATVVAPDGATADAMATAISVLGPGRGLDLAATVPGVEAWMEWRTPAGARSAQTKGLAGILGEAR